MLILLRSGVPAGWRVILESLLAQDPNATVCLDAASVLSQPAGRHLLFAPRPEDLRTLNPLREILGERKLVMVWQASPALIDQMRGEAPDLHDWFSHEIAQPPDVPASAREALRGRGFVLWADGDLDLAMRQVAPDWPVHRFTVEPRSDPTAREVGEGWRVWRVVAGRPLSLLSSGYLPPRQWPAGRDVVLGIPDARRPTHAAFVAPAIAAARLHWFGARAPAVAAWFDLDHGRLERLEEWLGTLTPGELDDTVRLTLPELEEALESKVVPSRVEPAEPPSLTLDLPNTPSPGPTEPTARRLLIEILARGADTRALPRLTRDLVLSYTHGRVEGPFRGAISKRPGWTNRGVDVRLTGEGTVVPAPDTDLRAHAGLVRLDPALIRVISIGSAAEIPEILACERERGPGEATLTIAVANFSRLGNEGYAAAQLWDVTVYLADREQSQATEMRDRGALILCTGTEESGFLLHISVNAKGRPLWTRARNLSGLPLRPVGRPRRPPLTKPPPTRPSPRSAPAGATAR